MPEKRYLGVNVLEAARQRIAWTFDTFPRIYVSFSGGKDSTVMLHLVMDEAIKRQRKIGVLVVDLEGQYALTIQHIQTCLDMYAEHIDAYWVCLPIALRNAVSQFEPKWCAWQPGREADWIRQPPPMAITDPKRFPFFRYNPSRPMEFEEFVPAFGEWYADGMLTACFVGIRTAESLNRWRTIAGHGRKFEGRNYVQHTLKSLWNVYPIYDWSTADIWTYHGKFPDRPYNRLYDRMHQAGLTLHQMRICQPYGDDQRRGLWLFHIIEPETWARVVARVNGANQGALYAGKAGNILGNNIVSKPDGHTWESFAQLLLDSMPKGGAEHFKNKIAHFIQWYRARGIDPMPELPPEDAIPGKDYPSWKRICKTLLKNDYWCKGIGFEPQKGTAHKQYMALMAKRRNAWGLFPTLY